MDDAQLQELKKLAGMPIGEATGGMNDNGAGMVDGIGIQTPQASEEGITSPMGSNISYTAKERNDLLKKYHVMPGTDLWFLINFSLPKLNGSLEQHVQKYLKDHPQHAPRNMPGTDYT